MTTIKITQNLRDINEKIIEIFDNQNKKYIKRNRKLNLNDIFHFMCHKHGANLSYNECNFNLSKCLNNNKKIASNTAYLKKIQKWNLSDVESIHTEFNKYIYNKNIKNENRFFAVDGSDLNLSKFIDENNINYTLSKSKQYKKGFISGIIDVDSKIIISNKMYDSTNERQNFINQFNDLKNNGSLKNTDVFIFDAGYFSHELINFLIENKVEYIFRLPISNTYSKNLIKQNKNDILETYKISKTNKIDVRSIFFELTCSKELCKKGKKNLDKKEKYFILTSLVDINKYKTEDFKNLYHKRWNVETYFRQLKYFASFARVNYKSIEMICKFMSATNFLFSFVAFLENMIGEHITKNKLKKLNKKITLKEMSCEILFYLLKKKITNTKLKFILNLFILMNEYTMSIQTDRHYRRVTKRPINGWSNVGSFYK